MARKVLSTTMNADVLRALKVQAVKEGRPLAAVMEEAARTYLAKKAAEDPDAQLFLRRAREPLEDCLAAIERRVAQIKKKQRA
jgi:hypothetical protein